MLWLGSGVAWSRRADSQGQLFDTLEAAALHQPLKHSSQMAWRRLGSSTVAVAGGISAKASEMPPVGRFIFAPVESSRRQGANGIGQMVLGNPATARAMARASESSAREAAAEGLLELGDPGGALGCLPPSEELSLRARRVAVRSRYS